MDISKQMLHAKGHNPAAGLPSEPQNELNAIYRTIYMCLLHHGHLQKSKWKTLTTREQ